MRLTLERGSCYSSSLGMVGFAPKRTITYTEGWPRAPFCSMSRWFFFSSRRRHTRLQGDWSSDVCSSDLGLRWEIPLPQREVLNRESGFDPTVPNPGADNILGALVFLGSCQTCFHRNSFQDWYFKEFGPRIGLAYQIQKNLVIRGGYGISYGPPIENNFGSQNLFGFNSGVPLNRGTSPTGFPQDPVTYLSTLKSAPLPALAQVGVPAFTGTLPNRDPASANGQTLDFMPRNAAAQPYAQNWSTGLQYLFPHDVMLQADYVGSK